MVTQMTTAQVEKLRTLTGRISRNFSGIADSPMCFKAELLVHTGAVLFSAVNVGRNPDRAFYHTAVIISVNGLVGAAEGTIPHEYLM